MLPLDEETRSDAGGDASPDVASVPGVREAVQRDCEGDLLLERVPAEGEVSAHEGGEAVTETEVISQAASENTEPVKKRGRGRPRLMNELVQSIVDRSWPGHTERTQRSNYWRIEAIGALKPHEEFGWLLDEKHLKKSLLTQLGYIPDAELMRTVARFLCERKPKTKYAERCLRSWRRSLKWETWCKLAQTGFPADDAAGEKFLCDYRQDGERLLREEFYEEFYADEISEAASKNEGVSNE